MKDWILAATTLLLIQSADVEAQGWFASRSDCRQNTNDCQKKCPRPVQPVPERKCPEQPSCPKPYCPPPKVDPCCPPVCFERGLPTEPCCTPTAYSEPAGIEIRNGQDLRFSVSVLYWMAMQDGMEYGIPSQTTSIAPVPDGGNFNPSASGIPVLTQSFSYKPGFKLGAGWIGVKDNWVLYGEYTRLHGSTSQSAPAIAPGTAFEGGVAVPPIGVWIPTNWFGTNYYANDVTSNINSNWRYGVDILDIQISRPFYSGARLTIEPIFGGRFASIDQNLHLESTNLPTASVAVPSPSRNAHYKSDSWGVGPRAGMNGSWLMGSGVRFIGNAAASLLYTRYPKVSAKVTPSDVGELPINVRFESFGTLRPNMDLSFGLGWGSYFRCRRVFWDLAATYDFSLFWNQNMLRTLADNMNAFTSGSSPNFYLHGLTVRTQFSF